jgi:hypothetical protein
MKTLNIIIEASMSIPNIILLENYLEKNPSQVYSYFSHDNRYFNKSPTLKQTLFLHEGIKYVHIIKDHFKPHALISKVDVFPTIQGSIHVLIIYIKLNAFRDSCKHCGFDHYSPCDSLFYP